MKHVVQLQMQWLKEIYKRRTELERAGTRVCDLVKRSKKVDTSFVAVYSNYLFKDSRPKKTTGKRVSSFFICSSYQERRV